MFSRSMDLSDRLRLLRVSLALAPLRGGQEGLYQLLTELLVLGLAGLAFGPSVGFGPGVVG